VSADKERRDFRWLRSDELLVPIRVDGASYHVGLRIDWVEHARRGRTGLGALTSSGLLHALWGLPWGIPVARAALSELDRHTIENEGQGWVEGHGPSLVRRYAPSGAVASVAVRHRSLSGAIARAGAHPPTVRRIAIWDRASSAPVRPDPLQLVRASTLGIGISVCSGGGGGAAVELVAPAEAIVGLPAVFRWWQAELAYRNWLMRTRPTAPAALSA
jgi:hypothetical protein